MNKGMNISDFVDEVKRREIKKVDYLASSNAVFMDSEGKNLIFRNLGQERFGINDLPHQQIASHYGIPMNYYRKMQNDRPELLSINVNRWAEKKDEKRFIRTLDGKVRAFLSDRFKPYDNMSVMTALESILPEIGDSLSVKSSNLSDNKLYIQIVNQRLEAEVAKGDVVQAGIVISNSEVGLGRFIIEKMIYRLVCLNGAISGQLIGKTHLGKRITGEDGIAWKPDTLEMDMKSFNLQIRDVIHDALSQETFNNLLLTARTAKDSVIPATSVEPLIEEVTKRYQFEDDSRGGILASMIDGGDLSRWGLVNAVTAQAHNIEDYDCSVDYQRAGGELLTMPTDKWDTLIKGVQ